MKEIIIQNAVKTRRKGENSNERWQKDEIEGRRASESSR